MMIATRHLHSNSLAFAQREVLRARRRAHRAVAHLESVGELPIPELEKLAHESAARAVAHYRAAIDKRAFEIRQLL